MSQIVVLCNLQEIWNVRTQSEKEVNVIRKKTEG